MKLKKLKLLPTFLTKLLNNFCQIQRNLRLIMTRKIISQLMSEINVNEINKRVQNLFRTLQNDPKSIFYTIKKLSKTILIKAKKQFMIKIKYL